MKIALMMENSQAKKNDIVFQTLKKVVEPLGHEVVNYGMFGIDNEEQLTYVQLGLMASLVLSSKAADFVITGCGTGEGAMLACNSFPNVLCGYVVEATDAYLFSQVNNGNAIALPFAKGFGWGGEINLEYIFEKLFSCEFGLGYPRERAIPEQRNKRILDEVKKVTYRPLKDIVKEIDPALVKGVLNAEGFKANFYKDCKDQELLSVLESVK